MSSSTKKSTSGLSARPVRRARLRPPGARQDELRATRCAKELRNEDPGRESTISSSTILSTYVSCSPDLLQSCTISRLSAPSGGEESSSTIQCASRATLQPSTAAATQRFKISGRFAVPTAMTVLLIAVAGEDRHRDCLS